VALYEELEGSIHGIEKLDRKSDSVPCKQYSRRKNIDNSKTMRLLLDDLSQ
jgi:hypothetical protein